MWHKAGNNTEKKKVFGLTKKINPNTETRTS